MARVLVEVRVSRQRIRLSAGYGSSDSFSFSGGLFRSVDWAQSFSYRKHLRHLLVRL